MRVRRLHLEHFRGIRSLELEFPESGPAVFFGKNGAGKTAVLDALALGLRLVVSQAYELEPGFFIPAEDVSNDSRNGTQWQDAVIQLSFAAGELSPTLALHRSKAIMDLRLKSWLGDERLARSVGLPLLVAYRTDRATKHDVAPAEDPAVFEPRLAHQGALDGGTAEFDPFFRWFLARENYENERFREDQRYVDPQLEAVRHAIERMTGFEKPRIRRSPSPRLVVSKKGEELALQQLSDGERNLLALAGDLARRLALAHPDSPSPLDGPGIVLIDEIELHLHPAWQRSVLAQLGEAFPGCQFIAASHSPQVMGEVRSENILLLERTGSEVTVSHPQGAYGLDSSTLLEFMGAAPRSLVVSAELAELFRLIDEGQLEEARALRQRIERDIGPAEPELAKAETLLWRREKLNR